VGPREEGRLSPERCGGAQGRQERGAENVPRSGQSHLLRRKKTSMPAATAIMIPHTKK
jgi:hypothetical protein